MKSDEESEQREHGAVEVWASTDHDANKAVEGTAHPKRVRAPHRWRSQMR